MTDTSTPAVIPTPIEGQTSQKTAKLYIPVTNVTDEGVVLCGVLEQVAPEEPTQGRRLALILHGTMGHKDYLFQKRLALRLPIDSFRFDYRGNHESTGPYHYGGFSTDVEDLHAVILHLTSAPYHYAIDLIVGHSRGVVGALRWMCTAEEKLSGSVRGFVNVSGRYRMQKIYDNITSAQRDTLASQGFYIYKAVVARQPFETKITTAELEKFASFDTSLVWDQFPSHTHVLSLQGLQDRIVPPFDATIYARALGARRPGTHNLCYVEEADHNFTGLSDVVVGKILDWYEQLERSQLKTGVLETGVRVKL